MLTRFVRIQLLIFTIASIIGVIAMTLTYVQVPTLLGIGRITITLELPESGGLYRFSNVTYRGVQIGKVTAVGLTANGAEAKLSVDGSPKIPADLRAEVHSISAVGEQYVDLLPNTESPPYLRNGSVISMRHTSIPPPVGPMLDQVSMLINSIPKDKLSVLLDESFNSFNGSGYDFGSLMDSSATVARDAHAVSDQLRALIDDAGPLLDTQAQTADSIRLWARSLAGVTDTVAGDDAQIRKLLHVGPPTARQATAMLEQLKPTLPVLLANMAALAQIGVVYHPSLEQLLVLVPPGIAGLQGARPSQNYTGMAQGGFHGSIADPPPCNIGFIPPQLWRSPDDETIPDTPDGLYCKLPQDSPISVRGARNYPCMGKPGKRAPTVQICNSDMPFEPMSMHQHWTGPYPIDPNLLSQGIPVDDRVTFNDYIYGPLEGTPMPAGAVPPPPPGVSAPAPGPPPPHAPPGHFWPHNPAAPAAPYTDGAEGVPLPSAGLRSGPGPGNPVPPAPSPGNAASPPPPGAAGAAPSSFGSSRSGKGPSVGVAKYNPRTGTYIGSDRRMYRQSDLIASAGRTTGAPGAPGAQQTQKTRKTWRDLILTRS